jgi:RNA polymerase sigma factor (sigma-70 family)
MTEAELINGCIQNDRRCQNQLYKLYFPFMSKIAIRYYDNIDDAVASINMAFLKLLQNISGYDASYKLATYLGRILVNTILNDIKSKAKYDLLFIEDHEDESQFRFNVNESEAQLAYNDILKIISLLPTLHRGAFNLYVIDGYSHTEIAKMLSISHNYSKWLIYDSRKRIMTILSEMNYTVNKLKMVL